MRKFWMMGCAVLLLSSLSLAKNNLMSTWNCPKASDGHSIDVGDQAGHTYAVTKTTCTAAKSTWNEKEGTGTEFEEAMGESITWHGVFVVTADNGDKIYYDYSNSGKGMTKGGQFQSGSNKWSIVGGTGKFAHAKGMGSCQGKGNGDGTVTWECAGATTLK